MATPVVWAQARAIVRVGWLSYTRADSPLRPLDAFRQGMRALGYEDGVNVRIDARWGDDSRERMDAQASELMAAQPDVVVTLGPAVFPFLRSGTSLPLAFVFSGDPVEARLVDSLARPGRNMTGLTQMSLELVGKRMDVLRQALPRLKKLAVIANTGHPGEQAEWRVSRQAADLLGLGLEYLPIRSPAEVETALLAAKRAQCEAVVVFPDSGMMGHSERFAAFGVEHALPCISGWAEFARRGNLLSYGPNATHAFTRVAYFVDRILKGAKPTDLPVEQPSVVELVVNQRTARAMGITIAQSLLLRADEVIQ
jgi:putative tryptophan/tyrosine transport system substrate-binding protein